MQHYFSEEPNIKSNEMMLNVSLRNNLLAISTDAGVFSRSGIDFGSRLLIESTNTTNIKSILDIGCGYGVIGIALAKTVEKLKRLVMIDINLRAVDLAEKNCKTNSVQAMVKQSDGFDKVDGHFDLIVCNPPIRTGKDNIFKMYEDAASHINTDGAFVIVIQKKQGANSSIKKLKTLFKEVEIIAKDKGYLVIESRKSLLSQ